MRLIDADAFAEFIKYAIKTQKYDSLKINDTTLTVAEVLECVVAELDGTGIDGFKNNPTIEPRKTGKWIEVHGFCTPGGDPVWKCSECGKGVHVYGVESYRTDISDGQWKACPGCGAEMIKD